MIPTDTTDKTETWVCQTCSSTNAGWRLRCERCGVIVRSSTSWGPPLPQQWQQPPPAPSKKRGGVSTALTVVGCLAIGAVGVGAVGVGYYAFQRAEDQNVTDERAESPSTTEAEQRFFAADSQFRAAFPDPPERSVERMDPDDPTEMTFYTTYRRGKVFAVATFEVPIGSPIDVNMAKDAVIADMDGNVERADATTWQGYDAIEMVMSDADGLQFRILTVLTSRRVYVLEVAGMDDPTAEYETFKASFEITL